MVNTRAAPCRITSRSDGTPQGPEYDFARRFAEELGVKLKITPMRSYAEIYAALTSGRAHLAAAGLKVPVAGRYPASSSARPISGCVSI